VQRQDERAVDLLTGQCNARLNRGSHGPGLQRLGCFIEPRSLAAWCVAIRDGVLLCWCGANMFRQLSFFWIPFYLSFLVFGLRNIDILIGHVV
jgi:hypothetical protein